MVGDRHADGDDGADQEGDRNEGRDGSPGDRTSGEISHGGSPDDREFGWRGWVLVGFVLVAFFVVPGALYAFAYAREFVTSLGLGWRQAYLVLPLVPALILGVLAVWATTRP